MSVQAERDAIADALARDAARLAQAIEWVDRELGDPRKRGVVDEGNEAWGQELLSAMDVYVESSKNATEFLSADVQEAETEKRRRLREGDPYDVEYALLASAAQDAEFAQALSGLDLAGEEGAEVDESVRARRPERHRALGERISEADMAIRGQMMRGAAVPDEAAGGNEFIGEATGEIVDKTTERIKGIFSHVALRSAAGPVLDTVVDLLPGNSGSVLKGTLVGVAGFIGRLKRRTAEIAGLAVDKVTALFGSRAQEMIDSFQDWLTGQWESFTQELPARVVGQVVRVEELTAQARALLASATTEQLSVAQEGLADLRRIHARNLKVFGAVSVGLGVAQAFIPPGGQIFVIAGAVILVFAAVYMCGDALDSNAVRFLPDLCFGVLGRVKAAVS